MHRTLSMALFVLASGCVILSTRESTTSPSWTEAILDEDGVTTSREWGDWSAQPGERNVTGRTILAIRSTAEGSLTVRFLDDEFLGTSDPAWSVPILNNIAMASWTSEADAPCTEPHREWRDARADLAATITVSRDSYTCVAYKITEIPIPLPAQRYHASHEVAS